MNVLRCRKGRTHASALIAVLLGVLLGVAPIPDRLPTTANAAPGDIGYAGPSYAGDGQDATGEKPESKLWWNDGLWWAALFDTASGTHHIFRLNRSTHRWVDTGTMIDNRPGTRSDALWDGTRLYVASHVGATSSADATWGNPARLYRFSYNPATKTYAPDAGFPARINNVSSETLTIDKDSRGVLWATWAQDSEIYVNSTTAGDARWGSPFVIPVAGASTVSSDDISAVVATRGGRIGVMWSNQPESTVYFVNHTDGAPRTEWIVSNTPVGDPGLADDHISLRSLDADPTGRVFAVVKTSLDDVDPSLSTAPQILLLASNPATGTWSTATVGELDDCHTRPILMLDAEHQMLHVFLTAPDSGCPFSGSAGTIFHKSSPMKPMSFPAGRGTPVIRDTLSPTLNNVTSTKQSVSGATGLVILASNNDTGRYWHADLALKP
ncbi:hypothetical protein [Micromonospora sp. NPDC049679]|uniref:hypothetical protein n=1 Tax=Micromonospora sp. NPDC049679 TaxID=3155920 RepID=UPI0033FCA8C4